MPSLPTPPSFPGLLILFPLFLPALSSSLWRLPSSSVYISSFLKFLNIRSIGSRSLGKNRVGRHEMSTTVGTAVSPSPSTLPPSRLPSPVLCPARRSRSSSRPQDPSVVSDKIYPYFIARPMPMLARPRSLPLPLSLSPSLSLSPPSLSASRPFLPPPSCPCVFELIIRYPFVAARLFLPFRSRLWLAAPRRGCTTLHRNCTLVNQEECATLLSFFLLHFIRRRKRDNSDNAQGMMRERRVNLTADTFAGNCTEYLECRAS